MSSMTSDNTPGTPPVRLEPRQVAAALASAPARVAALNLSSRPFLNSRPVVRVSLLLWLLGVLLLLANVSFFWGYLGSSEDKRAEIAQRGEEIQRRQAATRQLQAQLDGIDLPRLNQQVDFLNEKIDQRTFSWSLLLDRLAEVLPNDARIERLTPVTGDRARRELRNARGTSLRNRPQAGQVPLLILGEIRDDDSHLQFVDNLFAHPAFADPNLIREERNEEGTRLEFEVSVQYIPGKISTSGAPAAATPTIEEEGPAPPAPGSPAAAPATAPPGGQR